MTITMTKKEKRDLVTLRYGDGIANLYFTTGWDDWKVAVDMPGSKSPYSPTDENYFTYYSKLSGEDRKQTYEDFVKIYDLTSTSNLRMNILADVNFKVLQEIANLSKRYEDSDGWKVRMSVIYYGMIAEENKTDKNGNELPLKKRVKRLGMYQVLVEGMSPKYAANFSRGKNADYLDKLMKERGF